MEKKRTGVNAPPVIERLHARSLILPDGCVTWQGHLDRDGYGRIAVSRKPRMVHRVAWQHYVGPLTPDQIIDHNTEVCSHRNCWNIEHLSVTDIVGNRMATVNRGVHGWVGHTPYRDTH